MQQRTKLASILAVMLGVPTATAFVTQGIATGATTAHTYYLATDGNDAASGSATAPWRTFGVALRHMGAGDTLIVRDGEYTSNIAPPDTLNGTAAAPVTIKAQHDGKAFINGQGARSPIDLEGNDYLDIEGFVTFNGLTEDILVSQANDTNWASHDTLRRVSAYNSAACSAAAAVSSTCNVHIISIYGADHTLLEDCAAAGRARTVGDANKTDSTTIRRCWFRGDQNVDGGPMGGFTLYNSTNSRIENTIWADANPNAPGYGFGQHDWDNWYGGPNSQVNSNNAYDGNIVLGAMDDSMGTSVTQCKLAHDIKYHNDVIVQSTPDAKKSSRNGVSNRGSKNQLFDHMTIVGTQTDTTHSQAGFSMSMSSYIHQAWDDKTKRYGSEPCSPLKPSSGTKTVDEGGTATHFGAWGTYRDQLGGSAYQHKGFVFNATVQNSVVQGFTSRFAITSNTQAKAVLTQKNNYGDSLHVMSFDTAKYGEGAYLLGPTGANPPRDAAGKVVGARVVDETIDGIENPDAHLWPFPMEERVWAETGNPHLWAGSSSVYDTMYQQSPTWNVPGYRTGGIWKTLQGVYPTKMNWYCATTSRDGLGNARVTNVYKNADTTSAVVATKPFNTLCIAVFGPWKTTQGATAWYVNFGDVQGWVLDSDLRGY